MKMRRSRVLECLRGGAVAGTVKLNVRDARVAEIAAMAGFEAVWLDMEHVPNTLSDIEAQVYAAKAHDVDALVRVARGSYSDLIRPLEMDAAGIIVPHVISAADARQIVQQTRFQPLGRRALDGGNADGAYCQIDLQPYTQQANTQRMVIAQIEDPEALEELDAIAAVEGIDMLFFGPGDYAHAIGALEDMQDPRIDQARHAVVAAARRHGKFAGTTVSEEAAGRCLEMGYQFLAIGADVIALTGQFSRWRTALEAASVTKVSTEV